MNDDFFQRVFPGFWDTLDRSRLRTDDQSMFGDLEVFEWLIRTVKPRELIEIGSWKGHSANFMIDQCRANGLDSRIVCVDTFLGGPEHWLLPGMLETLYRENGRPTILERFLGNTVERGNAGRVFPLTADSYAASEIFRHLDFKADLIFVDGAHNPEAVRLDIMSYMPLLSETGVMFGDDYAFAPLAETVHECARELGVQVMVSAGNKWIFLNEALLRHMSLPDMQLRDEHEAPEDEAPEEVPQDEAPEPETPDEA